jgi:hypothetical protein
MEYEHEPEEPEDEFGGADDALAEDGLASGGLDDVLGDFDDEDFSETDEF